MDINYDEIDVECRSMVKLFNTIGLTTKFSCQGHNNILQNSFQIIFADFINDDDIINFISKFTNIYTHSPFQGKFLKWMRKINGEILSNWTYEISYGNYKTNIKLSKIDYDLFVKLLEEYETFVTNGVIRN